VWTRNPNGPPSLSGKVYLSDLAWSSALSTMWTPNGLATTADAATLDHAYSAFANDQPISINGQSFAKGVSFLADGDVTYTLGGQCSQFVATVGGDDTSCGPMSFALFRDESAVLANGDIGCRAANQQIQVDLQGANTIRLDVAADPQYMGMAIDWADAYLVCGAQSGGWSPLGGTATSPLVVGANADGRLQVFERGSDGALWSNWQSGASWSGWNSFGGTLVADGTLTFSAMSNGDGKLEFFSQGTDQALWQDSQLLPNGTWGGFYSLGGSALRPVAGRNAAGLLDVFALGADAAIWHLPQKPLGIWSSWESLAGQWPPSSRVAVGNNADGRLQIFVRGTDGALWSNWQQTDGNWYGWYSFGTSPYTGSSAVGIASDPTAIQDAEGFLEVFARGTDGAVWHISQVALNGGWSTWSSLGGIATGGVAAANNQDGTLEVFVRGTDGALWHDKEATPFGSWTGWMPLGGIITGDPVAARGADGRIDVFATASDGATVWQDLQTSPGSFAGP
jgi:hypothetical protein